MSKFITVRILRVNSKENKLLLESLLPKVLSKVLKAGFEFKIIIKPSGKKSAFPNIVFNGDEYIGLEDIKNGIQEILKNDRPRGGTVNLDDVKEFQMNGLNMGDEDEDDDVLNEKNMHRKAAEFQKRRHNRSGENDVPSHFANITTDGGGGGDDDSETESRKPSKKKKKKKTSRSPSSHNDGGKSGKKARVIEQMDDDDIGSAFKGMHQSEDDIYIENMFINQQESPV